MTSLNGLAEQPTVQFLVFTLPRNKKDICNTKA